MARASAIGIQYYKKLKLESCHWSPTRMRTNSVINRRAENQYQRHGFVTDMIRLQTDEIFKLNTLYQLVRFGIFLFVFLSLICYDFVSSSTLEDYLCDKGTVLNLDAVCAIACDVISAIESLQDLGILHNNITTSNILIGQCPRVSKPIFFMFCFSRFFGQYSFLRYPNGRYITRVSL